MAEADTDDMHNGEDNREIAKDIDWVYRNCPYTEDI